MGKHLFRNNQNDVNCKLSHKVNTFFVAFAAIANLFVLGQILKSFRDERINVL